MQENKTQEELAWYTNVSLIAGNPLCRLFASPAFNDHNARNLVKGA